MATAMGTLTYDVLLRVQGSTDEPQVVGQITIELDGKPAPLPEPTPPLPSPEPEPDDEPQPDDITEEDR